MQCVVLAGGLGTRLRPFTDQTPKFLVPVAGRPFAHWQLSWLAGQGVDDVLVSIGHLGGQIRTYVGDGSSWGLRVTCVDEGSHLLGTAGALRLALDQGDLAESFLVLYGDSYLDVDLEAVWSAFLASARPGLMTVFRNDGRWEVSNARLETNGTVYYDKRLHHVPALAMSYVDYGLLALRRDVVERVPPSTAADLADLLHSLSLDGNLLGYEVADRFYEIGSLDGLADLQNRLAGR